MRSAPCHSGRSFADDGIVNARDPTVGRSTLEPIRLAITGNSDHMHILVAALAGLLSGGVLNAVADRLPPLDREFDGPFISDRARKIAWWEWLPLASMAGAMRARRMVIANNRLRYIALELATAAVFALTWHDLGDNPWHAALVCGFSASFLTLGAIDLETKYLPYALSIPTLVLALLVAPFWPELAWWEGYVAAAGCFAFFYGIHLLGRKLDRPLMGDGDAYLAAAFAAVLGLSYTLVGLYVTALAGGAFAICVVAAKAFGYQARVIPYGPFLTLGGFIALFFGGRILDWARV